MPREKSNQPAYRYHISGQAVVSFCGKNYYLGPHNTPESLAKYHALLAEYLANGKTEPPGSPTHQKEIPLTIRAVTAEYRILIDRKYASNPTHHASYKRLCDLLDLHFGDDPADSFGPRKLSDVRELFLQADNSRKYINSQVRAIVRIFRYAVSRELIKPDQLVALRALEPLRAGESSARESVAPGPVDIETVRKTAAFLSPTLRAMIRLQVATGMRPSEIFRMRPCDIDRSGKVWMYRPEKHKTANRGKLKAVPIIGDAREALTPFLLRDANEYCFQPKESVQWYREQRTAARKTPDSCGNRSGKILKPNPKRQPGDMFNANSYRQSVQRAQKKAKVEHWFPYQIRHLAATVIRETLGIEAAQSLLGHCHPGMTAHYARTSEKKAIEAAEAAPRIG